MDLKLLRDATRPEHEATEAMVPLMQPGLTRKEYASVLQRFHAVIQAWETAAASEAPVQLQSLVRDRTRRASLEADLDYLGAEYGREAATPLVQQVRALLQTPDTATEDQSSQFLGAMYVVEGSTLGGQYIASHVESELGLTEGRGSQFFRGYGTATIPKWREFQQFLRDIPEADGDRTIAAAKGMFEVFRRRLSSECINGKGLFAGDKMDGRQAAS